MPFDLFGCSRVSGLGIGLGLELGLGLGLELGLGLAIPNPDLHAERVPAEVTPQHEVLRARPQLASRGGDGAAVVAREDLRLGVGVG